MLPHVFGEDTPLDVPSAPLEEDKSPTRFPVLAEFRTVWVAVVYMLAAELMTVEDPSAVG